MVFSCSYRWLAVAAFAGCYILIKKYAQGGQYKKDTSAKEKIVIITGASAGIGKETARELAKRGATVYIASRDLEKSERVRDEIVAETKNQRVYCRQLDLASLQSVRNFVDVFQKDESQLDILINNAGIFNCPYTRTEDGFEMQLGVNHLGHFYLTNLLLDLLKKSAPSRIVVVSGKYYEVGIIAKDDLQGVKSYDGLRAYQQSKLANVLFTRELAKRLEGTAVTVNALHPGVIKTEIWRHMKTMNSWLVQALLMPLIWPLLKTIKSGAQTTIYAALDPDLAKVSGMYFSDCALRDIVPVAKDDDLAKWLWDESEKLTKLKAAAI